MVEIRSRKQDIFEVKEMFIDLKDHMISREKELLVNDIGKMESCLIYL